MSDPATPTDPARAAADAEFADHRRLADGARRVIRGVRNATVGPDERARALALLDEASAILEVDALTGPYWQTGLHDLADFRISTEPREVFPFSPAMGPLNPMAPEVRFEVGDDLVVRGEVTFTEAFNGPPWDTCHGGIIALVYDDLLGTAAMVAAGGGMTGRLTINYRKPTPLFRPIRLTAWLAEHEGRKFVARGEMHHGDDLLTEADGLFIQPRGLPAGTGVG